jgi:hypothetical protein
VGRARSPFFVSSCHLFHVREAEGVVGQECFAKGQISLAEARCAPDMQWVVCENVCECVSVLVCECECECVSVSV